jgi:hypothetical protein
VSNGGKKHGQKAPGAKQHRDAIHNSDQAQSQKIVQQFMLARRAA